MTEEPVQPPAPTKSGVDETGSSASDRASTILPPKMSRYILQTSALHQLCLLTLTVIVFLIEVVPLELQRRIVNDAVTHRDFQKIIILCAVYAGATLTQGLIKLALNLYGGWIGQRATRDLRRRVRALEAEVQQGPETNDSGLKISMIVAEAEPIGLFLATAVSEPLLQGGIIVSVLAYMIHIDLIMTLIAGVLFVPQFIFVPMMQGAINRRTKTEISTLRNLSTRMTDPATAAVAGRDEDEKAIEQVFVLNMGVIKLKYSMNFLMNLCTHLQLISALLYGGWLVLNSHLEIGGVVAFISGLGRLTDPWGDLVNYFRDVNVTRVKYRLLADTANQIAARHPVENRPS